MTFHDEVRKHASTAAVRTLLGSMARGTATGAVAGAATGAAADSESRVRGAWRGALLGGGLGLAAGRAGRHGLDHALRQPGATPGQSTIAGLRGLQKDIADFGRRQAHGFSGAYGDRLGDIGMPTAGTAAKKIELAKLRRNDLLTRAGTPEQTKAIQDRYAELKKGYQHQGAEGDRQIRHGVTSIPGVVRGLVRDPKTTGRELMHAATGGNPAGTALAFGLPIGLAAPGLARGDESKEGGPTMRRKLLMLGTNVAGGVATAGIPILPQLLASSVADEAVAPRRRVAVSPAEVPGVQ